MRLNTLLLCAFVMLHAPLASAQSKPDPLFEPEAPHGRRRPRQLRSEATVERIKHAMLQIIERDGYAAASTNRIAETAGVNIASLYRYFPNRATNALALYESALLGLSRIVHRWLTANLTVAAGPKLRAVTTS